MKKRDKWSSRKGSFILRCSAVNCALYGENALNRWNALRYFCTEPTFGILKTVTSQNSTPVLCLSLIQQWCWNQVYQVNLSGCLYVPLMTALSWACQLGLVGLLKAEVWHFIVRCLTLLLEEDQGGWWKQAHELLLHMFFICKQL